MPGEHSILAPSSAPIWGAPDGCTGYVQMTAIYPEMEESPEALEGIACHSIAAKMIEGTSRAMPVNLPNIIDGVEITEDMIDAAKVCVDDVADVMRKTGVFGGENLAIEKRIDISTINPVNWGTPDTWLYDKINQVLYVWDFKFGYGIIEAFENWQLIDYTAGILDKLSINGISDQVVKLDLRVIQPNAYHHEGSIRSWTLRASELRGHFNILRANADKALSANAETHAGEHCKHCSARHACQSAQRAALSACDLAFTVQPVELPDEAVGSELTLINRAIQALEFRKSGLDAQAESLLRRGKIVPGFRLDPGRGSTDWTIPPDEIISIGECLNVDLHKDGVCTPKQAIKRGIDETVITAYTIKRPGKLNLTPDDDNKAKRVFT